MPTGMPHNTGSMGPARCTCGHVLNWSNFKAQFYKDLKEDVETPYLNNNAWWMNMHYFSGKVRCQHSPLLLKEKLDYSKNPYVQEAMIGIV